MNKKITDSNRIGDIAEHYAITWLWDQGYEVFRNCGATGPVDLVAMDENGSIILYDVKQLYRNIKTGNLTNVGGQLSDWQKEIGVNILTFHPETRQLRPLEHRHETTYTRYRDQQQPQLDLDSCDSGC